MKISRLNSLEKLITCLFLHSTLAIRLPYTNYGLINRTIYLIRNEEKCPMTLAFQRVSDLQTNNLAINDFNTAHYFPEDYKIVKYNDLHKKDGDSSASKLIGKKAPTWILENIEAQPVSLADCKSRIILINFTGIGCGACQAAIPFLK